MKKTLLSVWLMCACSAITFAETAQTRRVDAGISVHYVHSPDLILQEQVEFVGKLLRFAQPVRVLHEVEDGPLYDPETQEIWMPGSFAE